MYLYIRSQLSSFFNLYIPNLLS